MEEENIFSRAFADDLILICETEGQLFRGINLLKTWCSKKNIVINFEKSGIVIPALRNTKKEYRPDQILGFPVVQHYKYLGVEISTKISGEYQMSKLAS